MPQTPTASRPAGHPPGLYVLFFTELWERYSFYSMMAILTLYMDERLHFSTVRIGQIYGGYIGAVYFMPLIGGFLADRVFGFYRAVIIGGVLMALGHLSLAVERPVFFYSALALLACGSGMLKPNVSTIVGNLYRDRPQLRDAGFNLFYMGINIGAFISPLTVSYFRAHYGWSVAFGSAAVAMGLSLVTFIGGHRLIRDAARKVPAESEEARTVTPAEARARVSILLIIFAIVVAFWIAFYQNGFTLTFWARDNTITSWPPERFQSVEPLGVILFSPALVWIWSLLRRARAEPSTPMKMLIGMLFTAASFGIMVGAGLIGGDTGRVGVSWLVSSYLVIAVGEICLSPMGLSLVTKIAPPRMRGMLMGGWFVATALGGYGSGVLGAYWYRVPHNRFFLLVVGVVALAAVALLGIMRPAKRVIAAAGA
ncbi:MAG: peptide MFS transporter [Vicinamibacterales bacterium]